MAAAAIVPDMGRRGLMNSLLLGSVAGPLLVLPGPILSIRFSPILSIFDFISNAAVFVSFLVPAKGGGGGGGQWNGKEK